MTTIFMGPYPARFTRVPNVVVRRHVVAGITASSPRAVPPLRSVAAFHAIAAAAQALPPLSTALTLTEVSAPAATALTALPTTALLTHVVVWQRLRTCCASATAAVHHSFNQVSVAARAMDSDAATASPAAVAAATGRGEARPRTCLPAPSPASTTMEEGGHARANPTAALYTAKRHYGSAALHSSAEAAPRHHDSDRTTNHTDRDRCHADGDESGNDPLAAVPSYAEIYLACATLRLVDDEGRPAQAWTAAEVKTAYRTLAKALHPDVAGGDTTTMEHVNAAYACLTALSEEVVVGYREWLRRGGADEASAEVLPGPLRWVSRDVVQLMLVGWCTTFSGLAAYASWLLLRQPAGTAGGAAASPSTSSASAQSARAAGVTGERLTLPRAGVTLSTAPGVQYGVVSSGASVFGANRLSLRGLQRVRAAMSRYALAVALTVAACVNTLMLQRVLSRLLTGSG